MSFLLSIWSKAKNRDVVLRVPTRTFPTPVEMPTVHRARARALHVFHDRSCRPGHLTWLARRGSGRLKVFALVVLAAGSLLAEEQNFLSTAAPATVPSTDLLLREVHYDGKLTDSQARFTVDIDVESLSKSESSMLLFDGDVAIMPAKLPSGWRLAREGRQYRLVASKPGRSKFKLELVAKITRAEPWNEV